MIHVTVKQDVISRILIGWLASLPLQVTAYAGGSFSQTAAQRSLLGVEGSPVFTDIVDGQDKMMVSKEGIAHSVRNLCLPPIAPLQESLYITLIVERLWKAPGHHK